MSVFRFKRGDTFSILASLAEQDISGWTIASQIRRTNGTLIDTLVPVIIDGPAGQYSLTASGATDDWPICPALCDIEYTDTLGAVISTETFSIIIEGDVTRV